jgi:hypothetical protein
LSTVTETTTALRLADAAQRLEVISPGYLGRVRRASTRLRVRDPEANDVRAALDAVDDFAIVDLDVPTASRFPLAGMVKWGVKRLVGWYLGYFGRQISAFGQAVANLGVILVEDNEAQDRRTAALRAEVARLSDRVARLEQAEYNQA